MIQNATSPGVFVGNKLIGINVIWNILALGMLLGLLDQGILRKLIAMSLSQCQCIKGLAQTILKTGLSQYSIGILWHQVQRFWTLGIFARLCAQLRVFRAGINGCLLATSMILWDRLLKGRGYSCFQADRLPKGIIFTQMMRFPNWRLRGLSESMPLGLRTILGIHCIE